MFHEYHCRIFPDLSRVSRASPMRIFNETHSYAMNVREVSRFFHDSYVRKKRFSDIRIFTNDFYTLKEHKVFPIVYISFPPFDERKAARNLSSLSSRCTRSRSTQFSILNVENGSLSLSLSFSLSLFFRVPRARYLSISRRCVWGMELYEDSRVPTRQIDMRPRTRARRVNPNKVTERTRQKERGERRSRGKEREKLYIRVGKKDLS